MSRYRRSFVACVLIVLWSTTAFAQDDDDDDDQADSVGETDSVDEADNPDVDKKDEKKAKKKKGSPLSFSGRVFVRNTSAKTDFSGAEWRNEFAVSSARAAVNLRKYGWLRGSLEIEFRDNDPEIRDVFLRMKVYEGVTVQVGNFKRPISPIALESIWALPVIERGILSERLETANYLIPLNLGARSSGAMVSYRRKDGVRPQVDVGLFNARLPARKGGGPDIADQADNLLRDLYIRAQIEPIDGFSVGGTLVAFTQVRFADDLRTRFLGSLDVTLDTHYFRAWLEGFAGRTPFFDGTESIGGLLALRVLAAGRIHKPTPWLRTLEPYAFVSSLDPTDENTDNQTTEVGGGVTGYLKKNFRVQLEYSRTINQDEFPQPAFTLLDIQTIRLQVGARFR